ncbi:MAG: Coproporphyrinogen-III oxidase [Burkholderia sp.]|jgi:oxygen-independent coproporphyrinogen III oxidase
MANSASSGVVELPDMDLVSKFNVPAPRYTSYPTADRFNASVGEKDYRAALRGRADEKEKADLSLYVHIPFCHDVCFYCGCNKIVTRDRTRADEYLKVLEQEADLVKSEITGTTELAQLHFGGGTPTYLSNEQLEQVMGMIKSRFPLAPHGEFSIEVDPRTCPPDKVKKLRELGLNRMSLGVQDFNPDVQKAVNRIQPFEMVKETMQAARDAGFHSVNMDLIYGLPKQTRETFRHTIDQVIELSPDRIALYHYAHLPNHFKAQRRILPADLPNTVEKVNIMFDAIRHLTANGYRYIGMDHFAKETDELSIAQREGTLQRNFQGYSTMAECDMVALGVSSISKIGRCYACNPRELEDYYAAIRSGHLATNRGYLLSDEDALRYYVIMKIMCNFELVKADVEKRFGINFDETFAYELKKLEHYQKHELVTLTPEKITVSAKGKIFVRAVAMQFDTYLRNSTRAGGYSRIA